MRGSPDVHQVNSTDALKASGSRLSRELDISECDSPPSARAHAQRKRFLKRRSPKASGAGRKSVTDLFPSLTADESDGSPSMLRRASHSETEQLPCFMTITLEGTVDVKTSTFVPSKFVGHCTVDGDGTPLPSCQLPLDWTSRFWRKAAESNETELAADSSNHGTTSSREMENTPELPRRLVRQKSASFSASSRSKTPYRHRLTRMNAVDPVTTPPISRPVSASSSPLVTKRPVMEVKSLPPAKLLQRRVEECYHPKFGSSTYPRSSPERLHQSKGTYPSANARYPSAGYTSDPFESEEEDEEEDEEEEQDGYLLLQGDHHPFPRIRGESFLVTGCSKDEKPVPPPRLLPRTEPCSIGSTTSLPDCACSRCQAPPLPPRRNNGTSSPPLASTSHHDTIKTLPPSCDDEGYLLLERPQLWKRQDSAATEYTSLERRSFSLSDLCADVTSLDTSRTRFTKHSDAN
eukprot:scpid59493/ scgid18152/ 